MAGARGCWYTDVQGRQHLDLLAGCWCTILGHAHPVFTRRVRRQAGRFVHAGTGYLSPEVHQGVEAFLSILPGDYRVALLNTGSEAMDLAIRVARAATGRRAVISVERGYYGATAEMLALTGTAGAHPLGYRLPVPDCSRCEHSLPACGLGCTEPPDPLCGVAAVVCEPILASGGMVVPPPGYLPRLETLARSREALLVVNEVTTGGGRTGRWFAHQDQGVSPDLVVVGKAFGNGFPAAALLVRDEVEDRARRAGLTHVQSHGFDPFTGFLVATVIELVREEGLLARAGEVGRELKDRLDKLAERFPVRNVRGDGLLLAFDVPEPGFSAVARRLEELGVVVGAQPVHSTFRLLPALVLGEVEIAVFAGALEDSLSRLP